MCIALTDIFIKIVSLQAGDKCLLVHEIYEPSKCRKIWLFTTDIGPFFYGIERFTINLLCFNKKPGVQP